MPWRQDESLLRTVVDTAADGVVLIDSDGYVQMFNPACEKLFGYRAQEVIGKDIKLLISSPDGEQFDSALEELRRGERKSGVKRKVKGSRKNGTAFPMNLSIGEAKHEGTSIFVCIIHDLSEREQTARVLTEAVASIKAVVDTVVDGVVMIDEQGRVHMFNPACEHMFAYRADEVIGRNVDVLIASPDEVRQFVDTLRRSKSGIGSGCEVRGRRSDGSVFPAEWSVGEPIAGDDSLFVGIIRDLTESKRAEQHLRELAARLQALVDTAVDGVMMIDATGHILTFNPACEKLFGYSADEVIGRNVKILMPSPYREEHDAYLANYHRTGEKKIIGIGREVTGQRRDGTTFPINLSVGEAKQEGESVFVGIIHDLTGRKHTEAQLVQAQKMETVGQLSGGIAHDFNNLLTVVVGNAEVLTEMLEARPDMRTLAEAIIQAGERGAELTQRLLAFSRRQTLRPVEVDCNGLVRGMEKLLRRMLAETINIRTMLEPELWTAYADPGQLENALLNLAVNSRDAMPDGGLLTITTGNVPLDGHYRDLHPEVNPGHYVMLAVTDTGCGMPQDVLQHVFEPFFTTKEVGRGSGLGLSMVYGFVKQSNGHVAIYSEPSLGTTVRLYLPAIAVPADKAPGLVPAETATPTGRESVLVAEDDPFVRSYAVTCLRSLGYNVIEAVDGREAMQKLNDGVKVDVLFTDIVMPGGINGWELAEQARELRPGLKVLLTSGYALETLAERGRFPQGAIVLNKPYRKADLAQRLREALDVSHGRRRSREER